MRSKRDGQPIPGTAGVVTAEQQAAALGIDKTEPKPAPLALTPAQERRRMSGAWIGEDLDPPDYEASVVDDPDTIANVLGLRPEDFDSPLGSMPEGQPIPQPGIRPKIEPKRRPERVSTTPSSQPLTEEAANELRTQWRAHEAKIRERAEAARGDAAREAAIAEEIRESAKVGEALRKKLGKL